MTASPIPPEEARRSSARSDADASSTVSSALLPAIRSTSGCRRRRSLYSARSSSLSRAARESPRTHRFSRPPAHHADNAAHGAGARPQQAGAHAAVVTRRRPGAGLSQRECAVPTQAITTDMAGPASSLGRGRRADPVTDGEIAPQDRLRASTSPSAPAAVHRLIDPVACCGWTQEPGADPGAGLLLGGTLPRHRRHLVLATLRPRVTAVGRIPLSSPPRATPSAHVAAPMGLAVEDVRQHVPLGCNNRSQGVREVTSSAATTRAIPVQRRRRRGAHHYFRKSATSEIPYAIVPRNPPCCARWGCCCPTAHDFCARSSRASPRSTGRASVAGRRDGREASGSSPPSASRRRPAATRALDCRYAKQYTGRRRCGAQAIRARDAAAIGGPARDTTASTLFARARNAAIEINQRPRAGGRRDGKPRHPEEECRRRTPAPAQGRRDAYVPESRLPQRAMLQATSSPAARASPGRRSRGIDHGRGAHRAWDGSSTVSARSSCTARTGRP